MNFFSGKHITEYTVHCHGTGECDERIENNVDIIISKAENIYGGKKLDEHITLQVIPPRIFRGKKSSVFLVIPTLKKI